MSKKETKKLPEATVENLKEEIRTYHRETVLELMKNGALRNAEPAEKTELYRKITGLRSIELVEQIVADEAKLEPEYLQIDFSNYSNREFVQQVLKKCRKSLDLSADSTVSRFFILVGHKNLPEGDRGVKERGGLLHRRRLFRAWDREGDGSDRGGL